MPRAYMGADRHAAECAGRSAARCGVTRRGADGPACRSSSVSRRGGRDHRQFARRELPDAATGWPGCQDEVPREELLADPGPGPGATRARSPTNRPLEKKPGTMAGLAQGWAGHPFRFRHMQLTSHRTSAPDARAPRLVTHWADRDRIGISVSHPIAVSFFPFRWARSTRRSRASR